MLFRSLIERSLPDLIGDTPMIPAPESPESTVHVISVNAGQDTIIIHKPMLDSGWVAAQTGLGERIATRMRIRELSARADETDRAFMEARQQALTGRFQEAIMHLERVVSNRPQKSEAWDLLARIQVSAGELRSGVQTLDGWRESGAPGAPSRDDIRSLLELIRADGPQGYWTWRLDRLEERVADDAHVPFMDLATAHAGMGEDDEAIEYLIAAIREGEPGVYALRSDPVWDELRSDPRIKEIVRQSQFMRPVLRRGPPGI